MKMTLDTKAEKLGSFLEMLKEHDLLSKGGIEEIEGMDLSEVEKVLSQERKTKKKEAGEPGARAPTKIGAGSPVPVKTCFMQVLSMQLPF